jgi:LysM repeat protein
LSVAAVSVLLAFLGMGFGLVQAFNHPPSTAGSQPQVDPSATAGPLVLNAAAIGPSVQVGTVAAPSADAPRPIQANTKVLQPNYTVAAGDTLVQIAIRFNTSVARIQAFNNLSDPRTIRIGTKLVIPQPL